MTHSRWDCMDGKPKREIHFWLHSRQDVRDMHDREKSLCILVNHCSEAKIQYSLMIATIKSATATLWPFQLQNQCAFHLLFVLILILEGQHILLRLMNTAMKFIRKHSTEWGIMITLQRKANFHCWIAEWNEKSSSNKSSNVVKSSVAYTSFEAKYFRIKSTYYAFTILQYNLQPHKNWPTP